MSSLNISLYTINAFLILDNTGNRVFAKYYKPPHNSTDVQQPYKTLKQQLSFEKKLFGKIYKQKGDIILFDNQIVAYREISDVLFITIGGLNENECLLYTVTVNLIEAFNILLVNQIDRKSISDNYDLVILAVDESIDDGIILETDPAVIASRVTNAPTQEVNLNIDLSEKGLFNAFQFAKNKFSERLQQGL